MSNCSFSFKARFGYLFSIILLLNVSNSIAQFPGWQWVRAFSGTGYDISEGSTVDHEGNLISAGQFKDTTDFDPGPGVFNMTSDGSFDVFIHKLDSNGNFIWAKRLGDIQGDWGQDIAVDSDNNYYITGHFGDTVDFDPGPGVYNLICPSCIYVLKLNTSGELVWVKSMGSSAGWGNGNIVKLDQQQNLYVTGFFGGTVDFDPGPGIYNMTASPGPVGTSDTYICKFDSSGNFIWARSISVEFLQEGNDPVALDSSANIYLTGTFRNTVDFDHGPGVFSMTAQQGIYADVFILKTDSSGNFIWAIQFSGPLTEKGYSLASDSADNIYAMGWYYLTVDFDPGPGVYALTSNGGMNTWLAKINSGGNLLWAKSFGDYQDFHTNAMASDGKGRIFLSGHYKDTVDFDPGPGTHNLISTGYSRYILELDDAGNLVWVTSALDNWGYLGRYDISPGNSGEVYFTMPLLDSIALGPHVLYSPLPGTDVLIAKVNATFTGIPEIPESSSVSVYPNPFSDKLYIKSILPIANIEVMDITGRTVKVNKNQIASGEVNIELHEPGIYLLEIMMQNGSLRMEKVVKM